MSNPKTAQYSVPAVQKPVNWIISTIFYWRLLLVLIALISLAIITCVVWKNSVDTERYKNVSVVFGFGSVVIGIFYSILNYEHGQIKYKNDTKNSIYTLSFNSVCEWHKPTMVSNLKITKKLYDEHRHLIDDNKGREFFDILEKDEEGRSALVSILNYFECISLAINMNLLDREFMKLALEGVARGYINNYGFYIEYRRSAHNLPNMWVNFTSMVKGWDG